MITEKNYKNDSEKNNEYSKMIDRAFEQLWSGKGQKHELIEKENNK